MSSDQDSRGSGASVEAIDALVALQAKMRTAGLTERAASVAACLARDHVETVVKAAGGEVLHYNGTMPPDGFGSAQLVVPLHPADEPRTVIVLPPREVSRGD